MTGVIEGAQSYLWFGYVLAWVVIGLYAISLFVRTRHVRMELK